MKVYITGPSGAGTTKLSSKLCHKLSFTHLDSDKYFWKDTNPPFVEVKKNAFDNIFKDIIANQNCIISGDILSWNNKSMSLLKTFDLIVDLYVPWDVRKTRIQKREQIRFGDRIERKGDMYETYKSFLKWARAYDDSHEVSRNRETHMNFLKKCNVYGLKVLRFEKEYSLDYLVNSIIENGVN